MSDQEPTVDAEIGEACEVDFAAGPIEVREGDPNAEHDVLLYITVWCGDARRAVDFLDRHEIAYRTIDIEQDEDAARVVESLNNGHRSTPTIVVGGEHVATEPSSRELAEIFGVKEEASGGVLGRLRRG